ncbi:MAG: hypothetical protein WB783_12075 [Arenicellales bacterium]
MTIALDSCETSGRSGIEARLARHRSDFQMELSQPTYTAPEVPHTCSERFAAWIRLSTRRTLETVSQVIDNAG